MIQLTEHFGNKDHNNSFNGLRQHHWFIKAKMVRNRKEVQDDNLESDLLALAAEVAMATQIQIKQFRARLDAYDEATVKALMDNQKALDLINAQLDDLLDRAYVMEDGRRVFKSEDGTKVFDEHGQEVSREELNFELIGPDAPSWETFDPLYNERDRLITEREGIIEFQEKLDSARERISEDEISKSELDELDAELKDAMPPSVKMQVPGLDGADNAPKFKAEFQSIVNPTISTVSHKLSSSPDLNPMN